MSKIMEQIELGFYRSPIKFLLFTFITLYAVSHNITSFLHEYNGGNVHKSTNMKYDEKSLNYVNSQSTKFLGMFFILLIVWLYVKKLNDK